MANASMTNASTTIDKNAPPADTGGWMAFLVAVANLKGGCGKSTIAVHLACELAGKAAVVLVDADRQATASYYCSTGAGVPVQCRHLPLDGGSVKAWLSQVMAIEADYLVIDSPPHVGTATEAIIGISDLVLIPCTPSTADLVATVPAVELVRQVRAARDDGRLKCLILPSRVDVRTSSGREIEAALRKFGEPVGPAIHQRAAFVDAFTAGKWIGEFAPHSDAYADIAALAARVRRSKTT
jgi:chromosome partitioning protein